MPRVDVSRMRGRAVLRSANEEQRASTPLELLFDLTFVVAVGRAAAALHDQLAEGHPTRGIGGFIVVFFAVWWGWMTYTWFASGHDSDDVAHRLLTLVQMTGALVLAAGVGRVVDRGDFSVVVIGYTIMRVGLIASWLRVARDQPATRDRALRYALGLFVLQLCWLGGLAIEGAAVYALWAVLVVGELAVPVWSEGAGDLSFFHPGHIEERYGLFTIILLGESILSVTVGFQRSFDDGGLTAGLTATGLGGLVLTFAAWWLYFDHPGHLAPSPEQSFRWGYAHVLVFASLAAMGSGLHLASEPVGGHGSARTVALAVAVPVAGYVFGLALIMAVTGRAMADPAVWSKLLGGAAMVLIGMVASIPATVAGCAVVLAAMATVMVLTSDAEATVSRRA